MAFVVNVYQYVEVFRIIPQIMIEMCQFLYI